MKACALFLAAIAPFLDQQTLLVGRLDFSAVAVEPTATTFEQFTHQADPEWAASEEFRSAFQAGKQVASQWIADFQAAGGREMYMILSLRHLSDEPFFWVVPLPEGADAEAIQQLMSQGALPVAETTAILHNAVVAGPEQILQQLQDIEPSVTPPSLEEAFATVSDSAVQFVFILNDDNRRIIEEMLPELPPHLGGGPSTNFTQGCLWAAMGLNTPPEMSAKIVIQSRDAQAAEILRDTVVVNALQTVCQNKQIREFLSNADELVETLTPTVSGDRLLLELDHQQIQEILTGLLPSIHRARQKAKRAISMRNIRIIHMGIMLYAEDHDGTYPPNLQALVDSEFLSARSLINPLQPDLPIGYVYLPPQNKAQQIKSPSQVILVYEAHTEWGEGVVVGYADGHVEHLTDPERFNNLLGKPKATTQPAP